MPSKGDVEFGSLAIKEKLSSKERVEECAKYQEEIEKDGRQTTLDRVMLQKGYLTEEQVFDLNKKQGRRVVFCSKCAMKMNVAGLAVGQKIKCPKCGASNVTPEKIAFELVEKSKPIGEPASVVVPPAPSPAELPVSIPDPPPGVAAPRPPTVNLNTKPGAAPATVRVSLTDSQKMDLSRGGGLNSPVAPQATDKPAEHASDTPKVDEIRAEGKGKKFAGRRYGKR